MKGKKLGHAKHHVHHEHKAGSEAHIAHVHMKDGGKALERKKVEGKKAKARLDKYARGGKTCYAKGGKVKDPMPKEVDGNEKVVKAAKEKDASGVQATASAAMKNRPGIGDSIEREDD